MRALALAAVVMFGWSGVAAAAVPQTYNFSFMANGTNGSGTITTQTASSLMVTAAHIVFGGTAYDLDTGDTTYGVGTNPTLRTKTENQLFSGTPTTYLELTTTPGNYDNSLIDLYSNYTGQDTLRLYYSGGSGFQASITNESFAAAPSPAPGGGLISWLIAALGVAGYGGWTQLRKRRQAETALV